MKRDKRVIMSIIWVVLGTILIALSFMGKVDDFWNGMGTALLVIGILQLIRFYRFNNNEAYREKIEIAESDERNHFIRNKAWAWTGYIFILSIAVLSIVLRIISQDTLSSAASFTVCYMLIIYNIAYRILQKKY